MNGQVLSGRYEIVQVLGGGAFGKTFLAKDILRPGHPSCVVKQLTYSSKNPQALQTVGRLFKTEAEILERLGQHDQIPRLLAEFEENQEFYLVQQFIDGFPLNQEILPGQPWSEDQVFTLLTEVLEILVFVHSQGVIHRDIKPGNLMRRSSDNKLVLIDFGAVKEIGNQAGSNSSNITIAIGTPGYMPIEQLHGLPQFNSDIYSLGMIAIQALLGIRDNQLSTLRTNNNQAGEILWRNQFKVSNSLANVIDKMVRFDHRERYNSATDVLNDLNKVNVGVKGKTLNNRSIVAGVITFIILAGVSLLIYKQVHPSETVQLYEQGLSKSKSGNKQEAIEDFTKAIKSNPQYAAAFYERANARFFSGDYKGAVEDATAAINIDSKYVEAYSRRCGAYVNLAEYQQADGDCTKALELNPKYIDAYVNRAAARVNLGKNQEAITDLTMVIESNPSDAQAYLNRGVAYYRIPDYKNAIADFNQAIGYNPQYAEAYNGRGFTRFQLGEKQGAIEDFTKALEIKPDFADAYKNRAIAYIDQGNKQAAIADLQQAKKLYSGRGLIDGVKNADALIRQIQ
ncbi:MAG: serine/threonine-protein kinase [Gloeotrichia echinulata IR180]|nr:tetratricopeptide repeat protein [Gloeotrichia echinulata DEX184]